MHRLSAIPGGFDASTSPEGVIFIEQTPAPIVVLSAADTDIQVLARAIAQLPSTFPAVRGINLLQLQQELTIDTYAETVLSQAQVIIVRLLGGKAYWPYGFEVLLETTNRTGAALWIIPGEDQPDPALMVHSTVSMPQLLHLWQYWREGGADNLVHALYYVAHTSLGQTWPQIAPQEIPQWGLLPLSLPAPSTANGKALILFYRAHYLAGNLAPIEFLCDALWERGITPLPVYVQSLQEPTIQQAILAQWPSAVPGDRTADGIDLVLNTLSFSLARLGNETLNLELWTQWDVPILQAICSSGTVERWQTQLQGLSPRDMAMNVALPEVDGRIITRAISFKTIEQFVPGIETEVVRYEPMGDRIQFVADLAQHWIHLRRTPVAEKRVAIVLANYPTKDGRLANGVGLDTPASCVQMLVAMATTGYALTNYPTSSADLIQQLTTGVTNDPEGRDWRPVQQWLPLATYQTWFAQLPQAVQTQICDRWGPPEAEATEHGFAITGCQYGSVFVGIQPARGYDRDPSLNYHAPDLEPTHGYLAFYLWLRTQFQTQAIVHFGKHGNLEWLPGKSIVLSETCFPEIALGPLPHFYPFIVNDPGEGAQAKRRAQAVIIDHLTPPLTRAELYGPLLQLEALIDEYYQAQSLDPSRLPLLRDRIFVLVNQAQLQQELGLTTDANPEQEQLDTFLAQADGYLCELKEAQIRDGLHIFGQCPQDQQFQDLVLALARCPTSHHRGLTRAIADSWQLDLDPWVEDPATVLTPTQIQIIQTHIPQAQPRIIGDAIACFEAYAVQLIQPWLTPSNDQSLSSEQLIAMPELAWIRDRLIPALRQTTDEQEHLLRGLAGRYVPSGASGAPTRGRPEVLPTGRNFYSVDIRSLPTETAWDVGRRAAELLIERYTQEQGDYPRTLGLSLWGTATMRTGGDDIAEALALLGVRPIWEGPSRRVVDFEVIPIASLRRPRVDVTLRVSGFFRDAFANLIQLFDQAVIAVAALPESAEENPLAAAIATETRHWQQQGLELEQAQLRSRFRVFGSKPGAYGAGLQGLIEAQNWESDADLAEAYLNWSHYAYTGASESHDGAAAFRQRLGELQIVLHNQDNREHDLLDSDDYYQFQGGLTAAVRHLQGQNPTTYFGDHSRPQAPKVRSLQEEIARVYRSRVINPKWIAGVMRHGYKGAFEMAATVDYLFAYDASAHCVEDHMYAGVAQAYVFDPAVQDFLQQANPWALRDMAERLLEAHQRQLWTGVEGGMVDQLRAIAHAAEARIEGTIGN